MPGFEHVTPLPLGCLDLATRFCFIIMMNSNTYITKISVLVNRGKTKILASKLLDVSSSFPIQLTFSSDITIKTQSYEIVTKLLSKKSLITV